MKKKTAKNIKYIGGLVLLIAFALFELFSGNLDFLMGNTDISAQTSSNTTSTIIDNLDIDPSNLQVYFFDVGQADSILVISNGETMLIDCGNDADGNLIANFIKSDLGISTITYLVGTHAHEDHIGGMDKVIDSLDIKNVYLPYSVTASKELEEVLDSLDKKDLSIIVPDIDDKFTVGNTDCTILSVDNSEPSNLNLSSIVIRMVYNEQSYLFTGDMETKNESAKSNWPKTNVLKVAHHGSNTSSSKKFLEAISPEVAIISCGLNNTYGHPKQTIIDRLEALNTMIYRTDVDGTILISSDGTSNMIQKLDISLDGNKK